MGDVAKATCMLSFKRGQISLRWKAAVQPGALITRDMRHWYRTNGAFNEAVQPILLYLPVFLTRVPRDGMMVRWSPYFPANPFFEVEDTGSLRQTGASFRPSRGG